MQNHLKINASKRQQLNSCLRCPHCLWRLPPLSLVKVFTRIWRHCRLISIRFSLSDDSLPMATCSLTYQNLPVGLLISHLAHSTPQVWESAPRAALIQLCLDALKEEKSYQQPPWPSTPFGQSPLRLEKCAQQLSMKNPLLLLQSAAALLPKSRTASSPSWTETETERERERESWTSRELPTSPATKSYPLD